MLDVKQYDRDVAVEQHRLGSLNLLWKNRTSACQQSVWMESVHAPQDWNMLADVDLVASLWKNGRVRSCNVSVKTTQINRHSEGQPIGVFGPALPEGVFWENGREYERWWEYGGVSANPIYKIFVSGEADILLQCVYNREVFNKTRCLVLPSYAESVSIPLLRQRLADGRLRVEATSIKTRHRHGKKQQLFLVHLDGLPTDIWAGEPPVR